MSCPSPSSPSSSSSSVADLEDEDESVRIAVRALGDMRNSSRALTSPVYTSFQPTPALSVASSPSLLSPSLPTSSNDDPNPADLFARVSTLPIVNTALQAYKQSKASSRVVKYGAEMMESSVKTISRPVIDRLPVSQLDEFAHRQLDRLGRYGSPRSSSRDTAMDECSPSSEHTRRSWDQDDPRHHSTSRTPTPGCDADGADISQDQGTQQAVAQRSRWQAMLLEAGGLGAAVSEESMRRLKYCLQWLQYATTHIDAQILVLRDFMASLQPVPNSNDMVSPQHMRTLTDVKRDVVDTIRQVVDIVSKYAGGALPEPARARVRGFILHLPQRWATASRQEPSSSTTPSPAPATKGRRGGRTNPYPSTADGPSHHPHPNAKTVSRPTSPASSRNPSVTSSGTRTPHRVHSRNASSNGSPSTGVPTGTANIAAQRILTLATESLDMLRGVTGVFSESLERADAWVERLKVVGIQRQQQQESTAESENKRPVSPSYFAQSSSSRLTLSRSSSGGFYSQSSYPPSPYDAGPALGLLSIASGVTTPRSVVDGDGDVEVIDEERLDVQVGEQTGVRNVEDVVQTKGPFGTGVGIIGVKESWARSRDGVGGGEVKMDTELDS